MSGRRVNRPAGLEALMLALVFAALLPFLPSDQAGQTAVQAPPQRGPLLPTRSFSRLFTLQNVPPPTVGESAVVVAVPRSRPRTKVVCGMTLIIVDSSIDPKFVIVPKPGGIDPAIRRVPKPMCGEK